MRPARTNDSVSDHGDVAAELHGKRPGGAAEATAGVQHAQPGLRTEQPGQPQRHRLAATVELVGHRQVVDRERGEVLAGPRERGEERLGQLLPLPVAAHDAPKGTIRVQPR
jgi:hypothetical protein